MGGHGGPFLFTSNIQSRLGKLHYVGLHMCLCYNPGITKRSEGPGKVIGMKFVYWSRPFVGIRASSGPRRYKHILPIRTKAASETKLLLLTSQQMRPKKIENDLSSCCSAVRWDQGKWDRRKWRRIHCMKESVLECNLMAHLHEAIQSKNNLANLIWQRNL